MKETIIVNESIDIGVLKGQNYLKNAEGLLRNYIPSQRQLNNIVTYISKIQGFLQIRIKYIRLRILIGQNFYQINLQNE